VPEWRITVEYVGADGSTKSKIRVVPGVEPSSQHWADRRALIVADGFTWHVCNINSVLIERIEDGL
jgi:hypothetical protein